MFHACPLEGNPNVGIKVMHNVYENFWESEIRKSLILGFPHRTWATFYAI